jgi:hypothetical protein
MHACMLPVAGCTLNFPMARRLNVGAEAATHLQPGLVEAGSAQQPAEALRS